MNRSSTFHRSCILLLALILPVPALAQLDYNQEDAKRIKAAEAVGTLGNDLFGEQVNFYTGSTSFRHVDLAVPGNNGLAVQIARSVDISDPDIKHNGLGRTFGDWELELPYVGGVFLQSQGWAVDSATPQLRCSSPTTAFDMVPKAADGFDPYRYWNGYDVVIPGQSASSLMLKLAGDANTPSTGGPWRWTTTGLTQFSCLSSLSLAGGTGDGYTGEGFFALTPDGHKYWFDQMVVSPALQIKRRGGPWSLTGVPTTYIADRKEIRLYASRIEDPYGNWVTYTRTAGRLTAITASDGRSITISYNGAGKISSVTDGTRTVSYSYLTGGQLGTVTRPDNSQWSFQLANVTPTHYTTDNPDPNYGHWDPNSPECGWKRNMSDDTRTGTITHPSGATGSFTFRYQRHVRASVPDTYCNYDRLLMPSGMPTSIGDPVEEDWKHQSWVPRTFDVIALTRKQITGPGLATLQWNYAYSAGPIGHMDYGPHLRYVTVSEPDGSELKLTFGNRYMINDGQLLAETVSEGGVVLQTKEMTYVTSVTGQPFVDLIGLDSRMNADNLTTAYNRPLISTATYRQGESFASIIEQFDAFVRPVTVHKASSLGHARRDVTTYHDHLGRWQLGQVAQVWNQDEGRILSRTEFDATTAAPIRFYGPGKAASPTATPSVAPTLLQTVTYRSDGTVATLTDALNRTTTLDDWHRGLPRSLGFADARSRSATVDAIGQVTSVTNEMGFTTSYAYDAAGRLAQLSWPSGDPVAWAPTTISYAQVGSTEFGLPAGHWRRTESRGSYRKFTYYDAMWRPVVEREHDTTNIAGTDRYTRRAYDTGGRVSFQSYPGTTDALSTGIWSFYDGLGRPTRSEQDSELGSRLVTQYAYLAGFKTRVTNPGGTISETEFFALDAPSSELPTRITAGVGLPEQQVTTFTKSVLGHTLALTRSGLREGAPVSVTRNYVYDPQLRLCKRLEPETGATVMQYDAAGNLVWQAAGLALPGTSEGDCASDRSSAYASGRRVDRTYDARHRLLTLSFPGNNGNQTWTYTADGLPETITTLNDGGATSVVNAYTYNRRRLMTGESVAIPGWYTWSAGYGYDTLGHLASQTYPSGLSVAYAPNALGQATQAGSYATGVQYHPHGGIKQFTYGNGIVHTMALNARMLPVSSIDSGGVLHQLHDYDENGNVVATHDLNDTTRSRTMAYDGLDRLVEAQSAIFGGDGIHRFEYDAVDNLMAWTLGGVKDYDRYVYGADNRLAQIQGTGGGTLHTFSHDVQGNVTEKDATDYHFDVGNRLRAVVAPTVTETYRYDGHGRRVLAWTTAGTKLSMYSATGQVIYQQLAPADQNKAIDYVYLSGSLVANREIPLGGGTAVVKYQHTDALGSPVAVTDSTGAVVERTNYDPYGGVIGGPKDGVGYTGHVMDARTGLHYMQQRSYDPESGQFTSIDPVGVDPVSGALFNRYAYADNNPFSRIDPDGRRSICATNANCESYEIASDGISEQDSDEPGSSGSRASWSRSFGSFSASNAGATVSGDSENADHYYGLLTPICPVLLVGCTVEVAYQFLAPVSAPHTGDLREGLNTLPLGNDIIHIRDPERFQIRNIAMPGHRYQGEVVHTVFEHQGIVFLKTEGFGPSASPLRALENNAVGVVIFSASHQLVKTMTRAAIVNEYLRGD